jgi:hypothetical protein
MTLVTNLHNPLPPPVSLTTHPQATPYAAWIERQKEQSSHSRLADEGSETG